VGVRAGRAVVSEWEKMEERFGPTVRTLEAQLEAAEARAQKAEAVVEAARNWVQIAENHTTPFAVPEPERLRTALAAYDEPPTRKEPQEC
jgi:hypothetical protein